MNARETQKAALEELRYQRSPQAKIDLENAKLRQVAADRKAGHSPLCSLTKCHPHCQRA